MIVYILEIYKQFKNYKNATGNWQNRLYWPLLNNVLFVLLYNTLFWSISTSTWVLHVNKISTALQLIWIRAALQLNIQRLAWECNFSYLLSKFAQGLDQFT